MKKKTETQKRNNGNAIMNKEKSISNNSKEGSNTKVINKINSKKKGINILSKNKCDREANGTVLRKSTRKWNENNAIENTRKNNRKKNQAKDQETNQEKNQEKNQKIEEHSQKNNTEKDTNMNYYTNNSISTNTNADAEINAYDELLGAPQVWECLEKKSGWYLIKTVNNFEFYFNILTNEKCWQCPPELEKFVQQRNREKENKKKEEEKKNRKKREMKIYCEYSDEEPDVTDEHQKLLAILNSFKDMLIEKNIKEFDTYENALPMIQYDIRFLSVPNVVRKKCFYLLLKKIHNKKDNEDEKNIPSEKCIFSLIEDLKNLLRQVEDKLMGVFNEHDIHLALQNHKEYIGNESKNWKKVRNLLIKEFFQKSKEKKEIIEKGLNDFLSVSEFLKNFKNINHLKNREISQEKYKMIYIGECVELFKKEAAEILKIAKEQNDTGNKRAILNKCKTFRQKPIDNNEQIGEMENEDSESHRNWQKSNAKIEHEMEKEMEKEKEKEKGMKTEAMSLKMDLFSKKEKNIVEKVQKNDEKKIMKEKKKNGEKESNEWETDQTELKGGKEIEMLGVVKNSKDIDHFEVIEISEDMECEEDVEEKRKKLEIQNDIVKEKEIKRKNEENREVEKENDAINKKENAGGEKTEKNKIKKKRKRKQGRMWKKIETESYSTRKEEKGKDKKLVIEKEIKKDKGSVTKKYLKKNNTNMKMRSREREREMEKCRSYLGNKQKMEALQQKNVNEPLLRIHDLKRMGNDENKKPEIEESKREEFQRENFQKEDFQREDFQREDFQREDFQREDFQREEFQREEFQREEFQREEFQREESQREESQREETKKEECNMEESKIEKPEVNDGTLLLFLLFANVECPIVNDILLKSKNYEENESFDSVFKMPDSILNNKLYQNLCLTDNEKFQVYKHFVIGFTKTKLSIFTDRVNALPIDCVNQSLENILKIVDKTGKEFSFLNYKCMHNTFLEWKTEQIKNIKKQFQNYLNDYDFASKNNHEALLNNMSNEKSFQLLNCVPKERLQMIKKQIDVFRKRQINNANMLYN